MNMESLVTVKANPKIPQLSPGDTVRVSAKVIESGKERIQTFQGVVLRIKEGKLTGSFTVRRIAYGVGVERTFPFNSPLVDKVEVLRHGKVRRARLYYLRGLSGKEARLKETRRVRGAEELVQQAAESQAEIAAQEQAQTAPAPAAEAQPKAETPKAEAPKAEAPKSEAPKAEKPKAEAPRAEAPKAEKPKAEAPKTEQAPPAEKKEQK